MCQCEETFSSLPHGRGTYRFCMELNGKGNSKGLRLVRLEATLSPSTIDTISGHAADTFAQLTAKYNDAKIDTAIASPISTNQRSPHNRPVSCMIKIRTAKLARSQRRRRICECSVVREL